MRHLRGSVPRLLLMQVLNKCIEHDDDNKKGPFGLLFYYHHVSRDVKIPVQLHGECPFRVGKYTANRVEPVLSELFFIGNITGVGDTLLCLLRDTGRSK